MLIMGLFISVVILLAIGVIQIFLFKLDVEDNQKKKKIYSNNVDMIRLDFTKEENISEIQAIYYDFANDIIDISEVEDRVEHLKTKEGITKGHFFRGVL